MTILLTTHYLEEADRLASQLAIVDRGRIVARGTPDELKSRAARATRSRSSWPSGDGAAARPRWSGVDGLGEVALDGRTLRARARDGARGDPGRARRARGARACARRR